MHISLFKNQYSIIAKDCSVTNCLASSLVFLSAIGAAYVFVADVVGQTWSEKQKLLASDGGTSDRYGISLAIHGDVIVVGAKYEDNSKGTDAGQ